MRKLMQFSLLSVTLVVAIVAVSFLAGCSGGSDGPKYTWEAYAASTAEGALAESVPLNAVPAYADVTLASSEVKAAGGPASPVTLKKGAEIRTWPQGQGWFGAADAGAWQASDGSSSTTITVVANSLSLEQELPEAGFEFWPAGPDVAFQTSESRLYTDRAGANLLKTMDVSWLSSDNEVMLWSLEGLKAFPMAAGPDGRPPWRTALKVEGTWWGCYVKEVVRWE